MDAAACGDLDEVRSLLSATGSDCLSADIINMVDKDGKSAFHYGCLNDDANLLKILLADSRVNVTQTSRNGDTGLHMSSLYAALEAISLLVADGRTDMNCQNKYGETPLHLCAGSGDKGAGKTASLLLSNGASLTVADKWKRGPMDVSKDNAENTVGVFTEYLNDRSKCSEEERSKVLALTAAYRSDQCNMGPRDEGAEASKLKMASALHGQLGGLGGIGGIGGIKLKKTNTVVKTMFKAGEGDVKSTSGAVNTQPRDPRRALSKLIDFPGDLEEIRGHLENKEEGSTGVNPGGKDSYGLSALHKFASWNKTDYLDLLIPCLTAEELNVKCPEGKTALHYAVEMAGVAAVKNLVAAGLDLDARDGKGRTVQEILDGSEPSGIIDRLKNAITK